jgi:uncharacterized protein YeeX (DUF496 family)
LQPSHVTDRDRREAIISVLLNASFAIEGKRQNIEKVSYFDLSTIVIGSELSILIEEIEALVRSKAWDRIAELDNCNLERDLLIVRVLLIDERWPILAFWVSCYEYLIDDYIVRIIELSEEDVRCMFKISKNSWHNI